MNPTNCSPSMVQRMFNSLLANVPPPNSVAPSYTRLSATTSTTPPPPPSEPRRLTSPPQKHSIRFIENDQNNRREKYDGYRWRLVCTWNGDECTNLANTYQLCKKHNEVRRNKEVPKRKKKPLFTRVSLPIMNQHNHHHAHSTNYDDDDDDIVILEDYCKKPTIRHSMNSNVKSEAHDFNSFSVEHLNETEMIRNIKSEPRASTNHRPTTSNDIEYISSKTRINGLNIGELISKNIPPLTDFEEECLATRLMERFPTTCIMLDAQLFLQNEAMSIVKRNYQVKMDTIAPEYFYDFLLRHPRVPLHYSNWFLRCKPIPPSTGCLIDTKVWSLSMIVRGATANDNMIDEYNG